MEQTDHLGLIRDLTTAGHTFAAELAAGGDWQGAARVVQWAAACLVERGAAQPRLAHHYALAEACRRADVSDG